eukprot:5181820-Ditylum_brightwellii.AAC.1
MVLGALAMGVSGKEITTIMAMLDLPHEKYFNSCAFSVVEDKISVLLQGAALKAMEEGLEEEIKLTLKEKHKEWTVLHDLNPEVAGEEPLMYSKWKELPLENSRKHVAIIVCFDMG